jgi:hypothetical protein
MGDALTTVRLKFVMFVFAATSGIAQAAPLTAEDRQDIMELIARYVTRIDSGDADGYVANFVPNGIIEWANGRAEGREEIGRWITGLFAGGIGADPPQVRHFVSLPYITGDGDRAEASTYVIVFALDSSGQVVVPSVGSYADTIIKVDGRWLFEKRVMMADLGVFGSSDD